MIRVKQLILFLIRFFIISIYLYFRLIYNRTNNSLYFINIENNIIYFNIYLTFFIFFLFIISTCLIIFILRLYKKKPFNIPNNFITKYINKIIKLIKNSLLVVNEAIAEYIPNSYHLLKNLILNFYKIFGNKEYVLLGVFIVIPYVLISISFLIDTFIYFKFYYFYKTLPLLIIPLLLSILIFLINELLKNLDYIAEDLIITHCFLPNGKDHFIFKVRPHISKDAAQGILETCVPEYLLLYPLKGFIESFNNKEFTVKIFSLLFMYLSYFFSCFYIIMLNIISIYTFII